MSILLKNLLAFQIQVRVYHWNTRSYARHIASGKLYEDLDKLIDKFIETLQARMGKLQRIEYDHLTIDVFALDDKEMTEVLSSFLVFLEEKIDSFLLKMGSCSDLKNIRDDMVAKINQTRYLFSLE